MTVKVTGENLGYIYLLRITTTWK